MNKKSCIGTFTTLCILTTSPLFSQEALKSIQEEYYDFLSLTGAVERPTLNYRTLSDSEWNFTEDSFTVTDDNSNEINITNTTKDSPYNVWRNNNLGTKYNIADNPNLKLKIYGPDWYNSFNTAAPYGQNDGALWQGKGYNTSLTAGARLEAYGLELTLKPQVCFSQNLSFDYFTSSSMQSGTYEGKASEYGYFWNVVDAPQRFGSDPFFTFDWGDSEIRYTWKTLTLGFGTQAIWLGPAWLNPMLSSNNAATYPKIDAGLRKTSVYVPHFGWYLGDIEGRIWTGYLSESDYFNNDSSDDHNMYHGLSMSYAPSFIPGLTLGANRVCLVKWKLENLKYIIPSLNNTYIGVQGAGEDQKMSLSADWLFPQVGFECYGEMAQDDGTPWKNYLRTAIYTVGVKKSVPISKKHNINGELIFEWNNTEMTQDFQFQWPYSFGFHGQILQGYTNKGQWIGSGTGYGGENRFIGFNVYHKYGKVMVYYERSNIDCNYIYSMAINSTASDNVTNGSWPIRYYKIMGIENTNFIGKNLILTEGASYNDIRHYLYKESTSLDNFTFTFDVKYNF